MADKDKVLSDLHKAVAKELLDRVLSGDANAADLNVARGFLKDNGIDATASQNEPMANLAKSLPFKIEDVA